MKVDLHIHTCLSPCADLRMGPRTILERARAVGLDMIGVVDHNCARNASAFAAMHHPAPACIYGVEVTTVEELHVLALFESERTAIEFGNSVYQRLVPVPTHALAEAVQPVVNEHEEVLELLGQWLGAPTEWPLSDLCRAIHDADGLCIPSHVDRPTHGLWSQLGYVPDLPFDALEVTPKYDLQRDPAKLRGRWALILSSDAHCPEEIGRWWTELPSDTGIQIAQLRAALRELASAQAREPFAGLPVRGMRDVT